MESFDFRDYLSRWMSYLSRFWRRDTDTVTLFSGFDEMKIMTAMYTIRRGGAYDRFIMMLEAFLDRNCEMHCLSLTPIPITNSYFHNHVMYLPLKSVHGLIAKLAGSICISSMVSLGRLERED